MAKEYLPGLDLNEEFKFRDYEITSLAMSQTVSGSMIDPVTTKSVSAVSRGSGNNSRIGRTYKIYSIQIAGQVEMPASTSGLGAVPDSMSRILLVWDTQTNQAAMLPTDVLQPTIFGRELNAFRQLSNVQRFVVLSDEYVRMSAEQVKNGNFSNGFMQRRFWISKIFSQPICVRMDNTTPAEIGHVMDNSLHLLAYTFRPGHDTFINYTARIRFTD